MVLNSLQQQQQYSFNEVLETFRQAGAVLHISEPKWQPKRSRQGGQHIDWRPLAERLCKHLGHSGCRLKLAVLCPTPALTLKAQSLRGCHVVVRGFTSLPGR